MLLIHVVCVITAGRVPSADGLDENGNPVENPVDVIAAVATDVHPTSDRPTPGL